MISYYLIKFTRNNFYFKKAPEETVWVVLKTNTPFDDAHIEDWETVAWNALWAQYPSWVCPFNQSNPARTRFDKLRHGWSSAFMGEHIEVSESEFKAMGR
jgi:hypothetical protein